MKEKKITIKSSEYVGLKVDVINLLSVNQHLTDIITGRNMEIANLKESIAVIDGKKYKAKQSRLVKCYDLAIEMNEAVSAAHIATLI